MATLDVLAKVISQGFHGLRLELLRQRETLDEIAARQKIETADLQARVEELERKAAE